MAALRDHLSAHRVHVQSLALGVTAGVCGFAALQYGLHAYIRGRQGQRNTDVTPPSDFGKPDDEATFSNSTADGIQDGECNVRPHLLCDAM